MDLTEILINFGIIVGVLVAMFIVVFVLKNIGLKKQEEIRRAAMPQTGADSTEFAERLLEKGRKDGIL